MITIIAVSASLIAVGLILTGFFIYGKLTGYSMKTVFVKTAASLCFVALSIFLFIAKGYPAMGIYIMVGAIFGMLGDVALGLKRPFKNKVKLFTLLGCILFALGHIAYMTGLFINFYISGHVWAIIVPVAVSVAFGASTFLLEKLLKVQFGNLRPLAITYFTLLSSVGTTALCLNIVYRFQSNFLIMMLVGGVLFAASDLILSRTYFGKEVRKVDLISTTICYYVAQFIIVFSLFFL